jgi:IclR family transcriptional regulator, acetate operon repressor
MDRRDEDDKVRAVDRATWIVHAVVAAGAAGSSLAGIVESTGLPKSTVHRLVRTLVAVGWLVQIDDESTIRLGPALERLGRSAAVRGRSSGDRLARVADAMRSPVFLTLWENDRPTCVERAEPSSGTAPGTGRAAVCAGSLATLAGLPRDQLRTFLNAALLDRPVCGSSEGPQLTRLLVEAIRRDHAVSRHADGFVGVAVPLIAGERLVGALSVEGSGSRFAGAQLARAVAGLRAEAAAWPRPGTSTR